MKYLLILLLIISFSSCISEGEFKINNVAKDSVLRIATGASNPVMLNLMIRGYTDDSFRVNHIFIKGGRLDDTLKFD